MKSLAIIICSVLLLSCQEKDAFSRSEMTEIVYEQNAKMVRYFRAGNASELMTMYTDSAKLLPDNELSYVGKEAIEKFWTRRFRTIKPLKMIAETTSVDGSRDIIYETGTTTLEIMYEDSVYIKTTKFANVWRLQTDGNYLLDMATWNDVPR